MEIQSNKGVADSLSGAVRKSASSLSSVTVSIATTNTKPTTEAKEAANSLEQTFSTVQQITSSSSSMLVDVAKSFAELDQG